MASNVIKLSEAQKKQASKIRKSERKWGKAVMKHGFSIIPSLILRAQERLGLSPSQLAVLLQVLDHWWDREKLPFPGKAELARRLNLSPRQVGRYLTELHDAGYIRRIARHQKHGGQTSNYYDPSGLVERLQKIAAELDSAKKDSKALKDQAKEQEEAATKPGGLKMRRLRKKK